MANALHQQYLDDLHTTFLLMKALQGGMQVQRDSRLCDDNDVGDDGLLSEKSTSSRRNSRGEQHAR